MKKKVFISFDYDNDSDIKGSLVAQSKIDNSPFEIIDMSIKEAVDENWKDYARKRIKNCDCMIVLCGRYTDKARGVSAELSIAREEGIPYFLLKGRNEVVVCKPLGSLYSDKIYNWTWDNLDLLLKGYR